jgi:hypothetical protein
VASLRLGEMRDVIDEALQYQATWQRAEEHRARFGDGIQYYGCSVGAIRATLRDTARRHPELSHDDITALSSLLWEADVYERRLAAVILLQTHLRALVVSDLTRLEGFLRSSALGEVADVLAREVIRPLVSSLEGRERSRADSVVARWADGDERILRRAAAVVNSPS